MITITSSWKPDIYIIARILEKIWLKGGTCRKSELQMASNLNYNIYIKYLNWMVDKELLVLEKRASRKIEVRITKKGLKTYDLMVEWIKENVGEL
ncbi:winged helix-turn-helix domain-containing protein [[Eubacterium] cellulosolvens]